MKKLKLGKENTVGYDVQHITKPALFIKGVGRLCECGCGRHLTSLNKRQRFYSSSCRARASEIHVDLHNTLAAKLSLKKEELTIYYKRGIKKVIKIPPSYKEIWELIQNIKKFREGKS